MKRIFILLVVLVCTSCSMTVRKIDKPKVVSQKSFDADYDSVWLATVDWFADNDIVIDKIQKESGLITAKHRIKTTFGLSCDKVETVGLSPQGENTFISLNATVRDKKENGTKVKVNISGRFERFARDDFAAVNHKVVGNCYSNGEIEQGLFEYIDAELR